MIIVIVFIVSIVSFVCMCVCVREKESDTTLVSQGGSWELEGKYDGEDFQALLSAMQVLGFTSDEQDTIFRILSAGE